MAFSFNERIERIGEYFKGFNIADGLMMVFIVFPKEWILLEEEYLNNTYNVFTSKRDGGVYFVTEVKNGSECLFEAIDNVIDVNKSLEEKTKLLQLKAKELKELFLSESLDKLKTLEFTFKSKQKRVKKVKEVIEEKIDKPEIVEPKVEVSEKVVITEKQKVNKKKSKTCNVKKKKEVNDVPNKNKSDVVKDKKSEMSESMSFILGEINKQ